jgi:2-aminoadipate transaminase
MIASDVAHGGFLDQHVRLIRDVYREPYEVTLAALGEYIRPSVRWTIPQGGLFLWVILPQTRDATQLFTEAIAEQVAFVPGASCFADGSGHHTLRLNFSNATMVPSEEGIRRVGGVLSRRG